MKIHYLATANIPSRTANSLQIVKMCEAFSLIGYNISLIVPNLICNNNSIKSYYDLKRKFKIYKVGVKKKYISGIDSILIPIKILKKSLDLGNDIIITRNLVISFFLIILKKKHIFEIHDDLVVGGKKLSYIFKLFNLLNSKSIFKLVFITHELKKYISKKYNYSNNNFEILADATDIKSEKNFKIKILKKKKIGYFGSIYNSRGILLIIKLSKMDKNNNYFIYGGSKSDVKKIIIHQRENLKIYPQISFKNVKKIIKKMDILLMPYTKKATISGDHGNIINFMSPMKMFDYLGAGKIIISSNIKVLREVLINNFNSVLIKNFTNVYKWKEQIDKVDLKKKKYLNIKKNAVLTSLKFTWKKRAYTMIKKIK